jgi:DNA-binding MarR family transcriptional regulator
MAAYSLKESLGYLLNRAGVQIAVSFGQRLEKKQLTIGLWRVLGALWSQNEATLNDVALFTSMDLATLSRHVTALEKRGLIYRGRSSIDRRSLNLGLTESGRALVAELLPDVEETETLALQGVSAADAQRLKRLLSTVFSNLAGQNAPSD